MSPARALGTVSEKACSWAREMHMDQTSMKSEVSPEPEAESKSPQKSRLMLQIQGDKFSEK